MDTKATGNVPTDLYPRFFQFFENHDELNICEPSVFNQYIGAGHPINFECLLTVCTRARWYLQSFDGLALWQVAALQGNKKALLATVDDIKQMHVLEFISLGGHWSLFEEIGQAHFSANAICAHIQTIAQMAAIGGHRSFLHNLQTHYEFDFLSAITVSINGHLEFVEQLVEMDLHCVSIEGMNLLHCAAYTGDKKWLCRLIVRGLDISSADHHGNTIIDYAIEGGQVDMLQYILQQGWFTVDTIKERAHQLLRSVVKNNRKDMLKYLIDHCEVEPTYVYEAFDTLLHCCSQYGSWSCYEFLKYQHGLEDKPNALGQTCAHIAVENGRLFFLKMLVEKEGKEILSVPDNDQETPLSISESVEDQALKSYLEQQCTKDMQNGK